MDEVYGQCIHFHPLIIVGYLKLLTILLQLINNLNTNEEEGKNNVDHYKIFMVSKNKSISS
jgi:hypothetical protein